MSIISTKKAIIFDMDGVLIDSEPIHKKAWDIVLQQYGKHFSYEWFTQWIGVTDRKLSETLVKDYGINAEAEDLWMQKRNTFKDLIDTDVKAFEGLVDTIPQLKPRFTLAVATSTGHTNAHKALKNNQLFDNFSTIVTGDDVQHHKPNPECYLKAAAAINFDPSECFAIEDSLAGLTAAKSAGTFAIGVTTSFSADKVSAIADKVFPSTLSALQWILAE